jgi:hypothetical protein
MDIDFDSIYFSGYTGEPNSCLNILNDELQPKR